VCNENHFFPHTILPPSLFFLSSFTETGFDQNGFYPPFPARKEQINQSLLISHPLVDIRLNLNANSPLPEMTQKEDSRAAKDCTNPLAARLSYAKTRCFLSPPHGGFGFIETFSSKLAFTMDSGDCQNINFWCQI
jgi:hypothetical protein